MDNRSNMGRSTSFRVILLWIFLVYKENTVICQVLVQGFIGDSVLLPCIYNKGETLQKEVSVFWRDKDDSIVLDISKNRPDPSTQNQKFRNRVTSFPHLFTKGNFSVLLEDVQQSDGSLFDCHIPSEDFQQRLVLNVSGKRVEAAPGLTGGAAATLNSLHAILLSLPLALLF